MAQQLIESLSADFDPTKFKDEYRERVLDLIERKAAGEEIAVQPEAEDDSPAPDLMAALEASLAEIRVRRFGRAGAQEGPGQELRIVQELGEGQRRVVEERTGENQVPRKGEELIDRW